MVIIIDQTPETRVAAAAAAQTPAHASAAAVSAAAVAAPVAAAAAASAAQASISNRVQRSCLLRKARSCEISCFANGILRRSVLYIYELIIVFINSCWPTGFFLCKIICKISSRRNYTNSESPMYVFSMFRNESKFLDNPSPAWPPFTLSIHHLSAISGELWLRNKNNNRYKIEWLLVKKPQN